VDCARKIDGDSSIPDSAKRPWLDQMALPIAATLLGSPVRPLTLEYNFPSWEQQLDPSDETVFYHYQRPTVLLRNRDLFLSASQAVSSFPLTRHAVSQHPEVSMYATPRFYGPKNIYHRYLLPRLG